MTAKKPKEKFKRSRITGSGPIPQHINEMFRNPKDLKAKLVIGIPTLGIIRYEWATSRWGQVIPINWSMSEIAHAYSQVGPLGYLVADARNIIVHSFLNRSNAEWLLFIGDDTILPGNAFVLFNEYMYRSKRTKIPWVSGLYYTKSFPSSPLVFRGRGNSYYRKWKIGDKVWVDATGMDCTLLHRSLFEGAADISEEYKVPGVVGPIKKIFETPRRAWFDPETNQYLKDTGTEDLFFADKIMENKVLKKKGWKKFAEMKYPFLIDTNIFCKHIDLHTGRQYP